MWLLARIASVPELNMALMRFYGVKSVCNHCIAGKLLDSLCEQYGGGGHFAGAICALNIA